MAVPAVQACLGTAGTIPPFVRAVV